MSIFSLIFLFFFISSCEIDLNLLKGEQYQDIFVNGQILKNGVRFCESRFNLIEEFILNKFNRPFTLIDLGAAQGYFSLNAAYKYNCCSVMVEGNNHYGTSAALEFAICFLKVKHLILLGHSQCGGIQALLDANALGKNDLISNWVSSIEIVDNKMTVDECAKIGLKQSYAHCLTFPWIQEKVKNEELFIHTWFFDIKAGKIYTYCEIHNKYNELE
jgi:hypothetical protein